MSRHVNLSRKYAAALIEALDGASLSPIEAMALEALRQGLKPKPVKEYAPKKTTPRKAPGTSKRAVYKAVAKRAGVMCECGCGRSFGQFFGMPTVDHFWGVARSETVESCWRLRWDCHRQKTESIPTRSAWFAKFISHCDRYGYSEQANKTRAAWEFYRAKHGEAVAL